MEPVQEIQPEVNTSAWSRGTYGAVYSITRQMKDPANIVGMKGIQKLPYSVDTILINIYTMVRNLMCDKERYGMDNMGFSEMLSPRVTIDRVKKLDQLINDECVAIVDEVFKTYKELRTPPPMLYLVFYGCDYRRMIPEMYQHTSKGFPAQIQEEYYKVWKLLKTSIVPSNSVEVRVIKHDSPLVSYERLHQLIIESRTTRRVVMVSHVPLDYHVSQYCSSLWLAQSHTGRRVVVDDFGEKVFKNTNVPFNTYTHRLLGDGVVCTFGIGMKERKKIKEVALEENWKLRTTRFVEGRLRDLGFVPPYEYHIH